MFSEGTAFEYQLALQTLSYAARLIVSELDTNRLTERILDGLADFGRGCRVALLDLSPDGSALAVNGVLGPNTFVDPELDLPLGQSPLATVIRGRKPVLFPLEADSSVPLPRAGSFDDGPTCLCLPLVDSHNAVSSVVTLELAPGDTLSDLEMQSVNLLTTLAAVALENARLFTLATTDGLTGLFARRFFDVRLREEIGRLRRHGGVVALVITDIDHFKQFNDTYGHQQGDVILRELATIFRHTLRRELDVPCRYGGEEYAAILPSTDLDSAAEVAERLRQVCAEHDFPGPNGPLKVTLSAGVAVSTSPDVLTFDELVGRADEALYRAKFAGRNRVVVYGR